MTSHGQPDGPRSARYILKDYVNGRLLYCHPPPDVDPVLFNKFSVPDQQGSNISSVVQKTAGEEKVSSVETLFLINDLFALY